MAEEQTISEEVVEPTLLSLPIHTTIYDLQQKHGIQHMDYRLYHQYCTNRLRRLRVKNNLSHGNGKNFVKIEFNVDNVDKSDKLLIILLSSERLWTSAMEFKVDSENPRRAREMSKKLTKATKFAQQLESLCLELADERTGLEATAYHSWINGVQLLEDEEWQQALENFYTANRIYENLSKVGTVKEQDVMSQRVAEVTQSIRFCKYNLERVGGKRSSQNEQLILENLDTLNPHLQSKLEIVLSEALQQQAKTLDHILFMKKEIPITNEQLRLSICKIRDIQSKSDKSQPEEQTISSNHVQLFSACDEALRTVNQEIAAMETMGTGKQAESLRTNLKLIQNYVQHEKFCCIINHNEKIIETMKASRNYKPEDMVHLHDIILQSVQAIPKLPGIDENDDYVAELQAKEIFVRARRCYYKSLFYSINQQWANVFALLEQALRLLQESENLIVSHGLECDKLLNEISTDMEVLRGALARAQAEIFLQSQDLSLTPATPITKQKTEEKCEIEEKQTSEAKKKTKKIKQEFKYKRQPPTLIQRLHTFDGGNEENHFRLADIPPNAELVSSKPIFFDVASHFITFPDVYGPITDDKKDKGKWLGWLRG